jgi:hypothetical protein
MLDVIKLLCGLALFGAAFMGAMLVLGAVSLGIKPDEGNSKVRIYAVAVAICGAALAIVTATWGTSLVRAAIRSLSG